MTRSIAENFSFKRKTKLKFSDLNIFKIISEVLWVDSERSDKCIDFTMIITSRNNASISNFGVVSDEKFSKKSRKTKKKKNDGKTGIFTQNQFLTESIFLYGCNSKTNHCKYLKFSPNVYVIPYELFLFVDKIFLAQSKYLKILYKVPHMHNFFLLAFEVQILTKIRQNHEYLQIIFLAYNNYKRT
ncbi:hypothetical protein AGLY_016687 [Aphis glycines]|uniref:Uncharacterized protein n=1 Tax=Aphis glycines TaxID=307491 RepID=A0A6G0SWX7_APHGL|nr:hypothetical protein AGLY_016687 [Aphis glycines]